LSARAQKAGGRGGQPRARSSSRSVSTRRKREPELLEHIGLPPGTGRRLANWTLGLLTIAAVAALLIVFRVPQLAGSAIAEGVGEAGFTARFVETHGTRRISQRDVVDIALPRPMPMPLVDLGAIRSELLRFGWVKEARVSRRMPDTIVVDVIERTPVAIWQNEGLLSLVDNEGIVLERLQVQDMPDLPLVIGPGANRHLAALGALLATVPHLRPQVTGATWVGERRWDVRFRTGETLTLPEGDDAARSALRRFAALDQQSQLLGRGFVRIDMRIPGRTIVRISREPGSSVPAMAPPDPGQVPADLSRTI
jgi:cell division protein FtsQ